MTEIISPLTEDERTILMLAAEGNSMIPIGRWEAAVKTLAKRGFLKMLDAVNFVITEAGRVASDAAEKDENEAIRKAAARAFNVG